MAFRYIEKITVSNAANPNPKHGVAFNGYIYAFNFQTNYADQPSQLSLNIVNKDGNFPDLGSKLSYLEPYTISMGSDKYYMYLVSTNSSHSAEKKDLSVNFIDGSHILDRTYVGLIHRHDQTAQNIATEAVNFEIPILCPSCNILNRDASQVNYSGPLATRVLDYSRLLPIAGTNNQDGGFLIVGREEWAKSQCELPEVNYNFSELKKAMQNMGIVTNILDRAPNYRQSYTGSLREVLNNWCSDFGVSFRWDYENFPGKIIEIDMSNPALISVINNVSATAKSIKGQDGALVTSVEEETDITQTEQQYLVTRHARQAFPRPFDMSTHFLTYYQNVTVGNIFTSAAMSGRTESDFNYSCALARYNGKARDLFLSMIAQGYAPQAWQALGVRNVYKVPNNVRDELIEDCFNTKTYKDRLLDRWGGQFEVYIGNYSEEQHDSWESWEADIANNIIGRYWYTDLQFLENNNVCDQQSLIKYTVQAKLNPGGEVFYRNGKKQVPWSDLMYGPMNYNLWGSSDHIRLFNRSDAVWSTDIKEINDLFNGPEPNKTDYLEPYMPLYIPLEGKIHARVIARCGAAPLLRNLATQVGALKAQGITPMVILVPKPAKINQIIGFGNMILADNPEELLWNEKIEDKQNSPSCNLPCELQTNLATTVCQCTKNPAGAINTTNFSQLYDNSTTTPWYPGLYSRQSLAFDLKFRGTTKRIIYPVGAHSMSGGTNPNMWYRANYTEDIRFSETMRTTKIVKNNFAPPGNVGKIKIIDKDVSQAIDAFVSKGQPELINVYIPGQGLITVDDHHNYLMGLLNISARFPRKSITVNMQGLDFGALSSFMDPAKGFEGYTASLSEEGISSTLRFTSRPSEVPKGEIFMTKIGPKVNMMTVT